MSTPAATKAVALLLAAALAAAGASGPAGQAESRPKSNLDYWLGQARTATAPTGPQGPATSPFARRDGFRRRDALPGVAVLSDGRVLPGGIYTTRDKDWQVWVAAEKRWRHIPPILVLGIHAVVVEEAMEKEWRWKEMGSDEKVYTGRTKPIRRFQWRFHLIDDSNVTGSVKGQPVWIDTGGKPHGPFVLHERSDGEHGQTLDDLVYVSKVVISRRAMKLARQAQTSSAASPAR